MSVPPLRVPPLLLALACQTKLVLVLV